MNGRFGSQHVWCFATIVFCVEGSALLRSIAVIADRCDLNGCAAALNYSQSCGDRAPGSTTLSRACVPA
jgi:hypothetical protein